MSSEEPPAKRQKPEEEQQPAWNVLLAAWRLDPAESYSDLAIVFEGKEDSGYNRTIHAHKVHLISGEHHSEYFEVLLRDGGRFAEGAENNKIQISIEDDAIEVLPLLFDFLYVGKMKDPLTPKEAITLLYLGDYFRVTGLVEKVQDFLYVDLCNEKLPDYLPWVIKFRMVPTVRGEYKHANKLVVEAVLGKRKSPSLSEFAAMMDLEFFTEALEICRSLIDGRKLVEEINGNSTSIFAYHFLAAHKKNLSMGDFKEITSEKCMTEVAPEVALQLLEMESDVFSENRSEKNGFTTLQKRCFIALHKHEAADCALAERVMKTIPRDSLAKLFAMTLTGRNSATPRAGADAYSGPHHIVSQSTDADIHGIIFKKYSGNLSRTAYSGSGSCSGRPVEFGILNNSNGTLAPISQKWLICFKHTGGGEEQARQRQWKKAYYWNINDDDSQSSVVTTLPPAWGWQGSNLPIPIFLEYRKGEDGVVGADDVDDEQSVQSALA